MLKPLEDALLPHVIVHTARTTNTPWGNAPGGMLLINPDMEEVPDFFGFVCGDEELGKYYGPKTGIGSGLPACYSPSGMYSIK